MNNSSRHIFALMVPTHLVPTSRFVPSPGVITPFLGPQVTPPYPFGGVPEEVLSLNSEVKSSYPVSEGLCRLLDGQRIVTRDSFEKKIWLFQNLRLFR